MGYQCYFTTPYIFEYQTELREVRSWTVKATGFKKIVKINEKKILRERTKIHTNLRKNPYEARMEKLSKKKKKSYRGEI